MVGKKVGLVYFAVIISIILLGLTSAGIIISLPSSVYNLGDELILQITLESPLPGYLDLNLVCPNGEQSIYHNVPEAAVIDLNRKLTPDYIGELVGLCQIKAIYGEETKASQNFEISNGIYLSLSFVGNTSFNPGDTISIIGNAKKKNGQLVGQNYDAFVEASINNDSLSGEIKEGQLSLDWITPGNMGSGMYSLRIKVYEKDNPGNVLSFVESGISFKINQMPTRTEVAIESESYNPGESARIIPFVYDQAGEIIEGKILIKIIDPNLQTLYEGYANSGEDFNYLILKNNAPGYNKIIVQKNSLITEKLFEIRELRQITPEIRNQTLILINTGNVLYEGIVEVKIGEETILKDVSLRVGEEKRFMLSAPEGNYNIGLKDSSTDFSQEGVFLTGSAISIKETGDQIKYVFSNYPIVWLFVLLVIGLLMFIWYRRYQRNKKFGFVTSSKYGNNKSADIKKKGGVEIIKPETVNKRVDEAILNEDIRKAEQVLVLHGQKSQVGIVAIKIKNNIAGIGRDNLNKALEYAYARKAVSHLAGNYILLIFSPLLTKSNANEILAVKSAMDIDNFLREHNRKFRNDLIQYGIGANSGELVNALSGKILQFANMGKTNSIAKKIAQIANEEVLLSKNIHDKTVNDVKVEKLEEAKSQGMDLFVIKRVVDTEKSKKFIEGFLRRN